MEDKEKQPITVAQLKEAGIDKLVAGLTEAIDKEDDANVGKALQDLTEGLKKLDSPDDKEDDEEKPDPFADKVAKYAPQGK
ncbi:MAG: hypothetical protein L0L48_06930 [Lactobacillus sp.]|uniref:hypothetical protein n=1 Tax=Lactococcus lactis TaxID=1358 RepID=UPI001F0E0F41|nr:hypothetical protein [Lactococcus lactis]MDN6108430.1 hypothetical protein [Lactococcus sp.]MDN6589969.1 hypothetical protein [Lactobacillus sp.]MCH5425303.1 hypothetical protein [Lactococcus lactis]MCT0030164.1 hypothetical protein [Lactococcus lactis subsp. lactis]MCT0058565.1 hypothetical protein [Lactococcus lactis subsp. lactis]